MGRSVLQKASQLALVCAVSAFVAVALLDPADKIFHLKVPLFALAFCIWVIRVAWGVVAPGTPKMWAVLLFFAFVLPVTATVVGLLGHALPDGEPSFGVVKSSAMILLIPVVLTERIDLTKHIVGWSLSTALLTLGMVAIKFVFPVAFYALFDFTIEKGNAYISPRNMLGLGIGGFYYATIAVVVFPIAYWFRNLLYRPRKRISFFFVAIFLAAMLCSDSRATALAGYIVVAGLLFQRIRARAGMIPAAALLLIVVAVPAGLFMSFFRFDNDSNNIKLGHGVSYAVLFEDSPEYLLWGQGADTEFYSQGTQSKMSSTELSYLELVRQFGVPASALILFALFYPIVGLARLTDAKAYFAIPYSLYLFEAATNPLLVSSTGLLVVSAAWAMILTPSDNQKLEAPSMVLDAPV
jgi:hypothetical protein